MQLLSYSAVSIITAIVATIVMGAEAGSKKSVSAGQKPLRNSAPYVSATRQIESVAPNDDELPSCKRHSASSKSSKPSYVLRMPRTGDESPKARVQTNQSNCECCK